jgi:hypothetical protein
VEDSFVLKTELELHGRPIHDPVQTLLQISVELRLEYRIGSRDEGDPHIWARCRIISGRLDEGCEPALVQNGSELFAVVDLVHEFGPDETRDFIGSDIAPSG